MSDDELLASLRPSELRVLIDAARVSGHGFTTYRLEHGVVVDAVRSLVERGLLDEGSGFDWSHLKIAERGRDLVPAAIELYEAQEALAPRKRRPEDRRSPYLPANLKKLLG